MDDDDDTIEHIQEQILAAKLEEDGEYYWLDALEREVAKASGQVKEGAQSSTGGARA